MSDEIIRIENLSKIYDTGEIQVEAIKSISLTIHKGEEQNENKE